VKLKLGKFELKKIETPKFIMSPVELKDYIDFEVRRIYFITQPKARETGAHCHRVEKEFFILIQGSCTAIIDRGNGLEKFDMQAPSSALYVGNYVWHCFKNLSPDTVLLALTSTNYNPDRSDYIENYREYQRIIQREME